MLHVMTWAETAIDNHASVFVRGQVLLDAQQIVKAHGKQEKRPPQYLCWCQHVIRASL